MDEARFMARVREGVSRAVHDFGEQAADHATTVRQHAALQRYDAGLRVATAPVATAPVAHVPVMLGELAGLPDPDDQAGLIAHWCREFSKLGGQAMVVADGEAGAEAIVRMVSQVLARQGGYCIATAHPLLQAWQVVEQLTEAGLQVVQYHCEADRPQLANATVGIHVASGAIAETGSLIIESHTDQGRYSSLLPPIHIAIVPPGSVHTSLVYWLTQRGARYRSGEEMPSSTAFATGVSRSADIAGETALGVHGPGEVYAILVKEP